MNTLRDELNKIINVEKIKDIAFLRPNDWQWIVERIATEFLSNGKQSLEKIWLWDSIKKPYTSYQPDNGIQELKRLLRLDEIYWFIASDEDGKYWVLQSTGEAIIKVLSEMRFFEYYISDKQFTWLACENHHDVMILKGQIETRYKKPG